MTRRPAILALAALALALVGGSARAGTVALPVLTGLDPGEAVAGGQGLTLRVLGTGLLPRSVVCWNGSARKTSAVGATEVQAELTADDLASPGTAAVTLALPSPLAPAACGLGSLLGPLTFTITTPPVGDPPGDPGPVVPGPVLPAPVLPSPSPPAVGAPSPPVTPPGVTLPPVAGLPVVSPGAVLAAGATAVTGLLNVAGHPGDLLTIAGTALGTAPGRVLVRGREAVVVSWSPTRVVVLMPELTPGPADVRIVVGGRALAGPDLVVRPLPNEPPVPNPIVLPAPGRGFVFDATLSVDPEGLGPAPGAKSENGIAAGIRSVLWNFGDGTTSTKPVAVKTYARPGDYRVTLRVTDTSGRSATTTQTVTAASPSAGSVRTPPQPVNIRIPSKILFDVGSHRLRLDSRALLRRIAKVVRRGEGPARVAGYTDSTGPARFNLVLSRRRAGVVRGYLVLRGRVAPPRIRAVAFGESRPLVPNVTILGRQLNRRVIIRVRLPRVGFARI